MLFDQFLEYFQVGLSCVVEFFFVVDSSVVFPNVILTHLSTVPVLAPLQVSNMAVFTEPRLMVSNQRNFTSFNNYFSPIALPPCLLTEVVFPTPLLDNSLPVALQSSVHLPV